MQVGFVGLGNMGAPMAQNIVKAGHPLLVWDVREEAAQPLERLGARRASSLRALAESCRVTFMSLPDESIVERVVCGEGGLLGASRPGDAIFDLSTVSPASTRRNAKRAAAKGVSVIDAPVTGSVTGAIAGKLTFMIGATKEAVQPYEPILRSMGTTLFCLGEVGLGNTLKLLNNLVALANQAALCEAMALADRLGISRRLVGEVLSQGSADSFILNRKLTDIVNRDYRPGFFIDLAHKDLALALDLARGVNARIDVINQTYELYVAASKGGFGRLDGSGLLRLLEPAERS